MAQEAVIFFHDLRKPKQITVDAQINQYLSEHPEKKITSASYNVGGTFEKALVIFDAKQQKESNAGRKQFDK